MNEKIIYIGLDVDDQSFHGSAFHAATGEVIEFKSRPNTKGLLNQLQTLQTKFVGYDFKICYEATYIGFTLQRDLAKACFCCEVIAPSSIPRLHGNQIKTDRLDAGKLAQFYASGLLTIVTPPEIVESNQRIFRAKAIGDDLKQRRKNIDPELVQIADRCLSRITKKGSRLLMAGKHTNKVKVACAREMVGFVWESLRKVA